jgi:hypothetical protein
MGSLILGLPQRYKSHSARKSLIHKEIKLCFFCGQSSQSLDFQGFGVAQDNISTKLSTEILNLA